MAIDVAKLRAEKGGNPEDVRNSEKRRGRSGSLVDKTIAIDEEWRKCQFEQEQAKRDLNALSKEIGSIKKADPKADVSELQNKSINLKKQQPELEIKAAALLKTRDELLHRIGNFVDSSVPVSNDESNNEVVKTWGTIDAALKIDSSPGKLPHHEILAKLSGIEMKKANEIAGHRAYYLMGPVAMLNLALIQYGQSFLRSKGYITVQPPFFMKREWMGKTAELKEFGETLYKIPHSEESLEPNRDDLFLIATSEQPLCALHANEYLDEKSLPFFYAGVSTCFRKEAGSHGKDMRGIFRVHQFEKVEQFVICDPKDSQRLHDQMIQTSEEFFQSLDIPYRVVAIVSGALNDAAAKKLDLEAWFPSYEDFKELVSCSNCTDYQSRDLNIRMGAPKMGEREKPYVHMLNGTLCATERALSCLVEHYQTPDGVRVPRVLQPYMDGLTFLPFTA